MATYCNRIIIQSDWTQALKENDGKAWISYKRSVNHPNIQGELISHGLSENNIPYVTSTEGFIVNNITKRSLEITFQDDNYKCECIAPSEDFSNIHLKSIGCLDVSNGGLGASACVENKLHIWESDSGVIRRTLNGHIGDITCCKFFPSGLVLLSGGADMTLRVWSAESGICPAIFKGHKGGISDVAIVDRGRNVISCSRDGTAKLWDCGTSTCLVTLVEESGIINSCTLSTIVNSLSLENQQILQNEREIGTEGKLLLLGCEDSSLKAVAVYSRQKVFETKCSSSVNVCCFLSELYYVCGTQNGEIYHFDIRNPRVPVNHWRESRSAILCLLPRKNGFFSGTGDGSCFWRDIEEKKVMELTGSDCDPIYKVVSDDKYIYTACRDGHIRKYHELFEVFS